MRGKVVFWLRKPLSLKGLIICNFFVYDSPKATLRFKDLVPVSYQEGRYQGDPVTLGVGGFGRVELVPCDRYWMGILIARTEALSFFLCF